MGRTEEAELGRRVELREKRCTACGRKPYNPNVRPGTDCGVMLGNGQTCRGRFVFATVAA